MKKILIAVLVLLLMVASYVAGRRHAATKTAISPSARPVLYWVDPMHPDYKSDHPGIAPDCGMELEPVYAENVSATVPATTAMPGVISIDAEKQQLYGIRVTGVEKSSGMESMRVLGRVMPEDTRVYRVNSGMEGVVRETHGDSVGELVKKDQRLAAYYGGDALSVASGFLAATAGVNGSNGKDGARTVPFPGAVAKQGQSSVQGYSDRLRNLGMSDAQIQEMAENRQLPESIQIVSPVDGFILSRTISPGQHFERATEFYQIADLSKVWIMADILGSEAQRFRPGTAARVYLSGQGKSFLARISNVLPQVDPSTRTLKLRLEADNPGFALRPDMFVDVELPVSVPAGLTIPIDAVIDSGRQQRVFLEKTNGVFEPREVHLGWRLGDRVEVVGGLKEGDRVVSAGTFLVDSESRLKLGQPAPKEEQHEKVLPKSNGGKSTTVRAQVKDASCGMMIDAEEAKAAGRTVQRGGATHYFCSDNCKRKFLEQADQHLATDSSGSRS